MLLLSQIVSIGKTFFKWIKIFNVTFTDFVEKQHVFITPNLASIDKQKEKTKNNPTF